MASPIRPRVVVSLLLISLLACAFVFFATEASRKIDGSDDEDDEDLSFLEEDDDNTGLSASDGSHESEAEDLDPVGEEDGVEDEPYPLPPPVDDEDVVVLTEGNFSQFVRNNRFVLVEFYAPWCGHCQQLAPEYAAAATELKGQVVLAKVDATVENELAQKYEIEGFPTIFFFVDGEHRQYGGGRTKDGIVTWVKKKTGPPVQTIDTLEAAESVLSAESVFVVAFLDSLEGPENKELAEASRLDDGVSFYQTSSEDVATIFHIDPKGRRPSLVLLKKEAEKVTQFEGKFDKSTIGEFVSMNKSPLVTKFDQESAGWLFDSPIKKQVLIFVKTKDYENVIQSFRDAAKLFKGKLLFIHVDLDDEDVGKQVAEYFGMTGDGPTVIGYSLVDGSKYYVDGQITLNALKEFGQDFAEDKLKPFYKSDPVPEKNDEDVKIIVGKNFDEIVLDESKDVLLEVYAPWCGHCQALEPIYKRLGKHLSGIDSLVIAKMDGTTNDHPRVKVEGFPTILFFPAGNKSSEPISVETDRTVTAFYKFLKKNASIPFKLQRPEKKVELELTSFKKVDSSSSSAKDVKDEL